MNTFRGTWNWFTGSERPVPKYIWAVQILLMAGILFLGYVLDRASSELEEYRKKLHDHVFTTALPTEAVEYFREIGCSVAFFENPEFDWSGNQHFAQAYDRNSDVWVALSGPALPARGAWLEEHAESGYFRMTLSPGKYSVAIRAPSIDILEEQLLTLPCLVARTTEPNGDWQPLAYDFKAIAGRGVE